LYHPSFPDIEVPGVVTVIVIPHRSHNDEEDLNEQQLIDDRRPSPGEITLQRVCSYLDERRLLTSEVYVTGPTYRRVDIEGLVIANDDADLAAVFTSVETELLRFLDPLTGGRDGNGWPMGGPIFYSEVLQRIAAADGVKRVADLSILVDRKRQPHCTDVKIGKHEIVYSISHGNITVQYEDA